MESFFVLRMIEYYSSAVATRAAIYIEKYVYRSSKACMQSLVGVHLFLFRVCFGLHYFFITERRTRKQSYTPKRLYNK
jgi:hypothetical protein